MTTATCRGCIRGSPLFQNESSESGGSYDYLQETYATGKPGGKLKGLFKLIYIMPNLRTSPRLPYYIGVTGVQSPSEVTTLSQLASKHQIDSTYHHTLMLGALASPATLNNLPPINTARPYRHIASLELLRDTMLAAKEHKILGMIHMELRKSWPGTVGDAGSVIALLNALVADGVTPAAQLNGVLLPGEIQEIHRETGAALVLQLRPELAAQGEFGLLSYIEQIAPAISMILLDPSAGTGQSIELASAISLHNAIQKRFPNQFSFGFAGGLGGQSAQERSHTTALVRELQSQLGTNGFSVDVESKVRMSQPASSDDVLDIDLCEAYFAAVMDGFR